MENAEGFGRNKSELFIGIPAILPPEFDGHWMELSEGEIAPYIAAYRAKHGYANPADDARVFTVRGQWIRGDEDLRGMWDAVAAAAKG